MSIKDIFESPGLRIAKAGLPIIVIFYIGLTVANFAILMPKGILVKALGISGSYQTDVMGLFSDRQIIMFYISVLCGVLIACTAEISEGVKSK